MRSSGVRTPSSCSSDFGHKHRNNVDRALQGIRPPATKGSRGLVSARLRQLLAGSSLGDLAEFKNKLLKGDDHDRLSTWQWHAGSWRLVAECICYGFCWDC